MSRVLITGCSKGLGRATAAELTRRGHHVIATARKPETLADLDVAQRLALDVTRDDSVQAAVQQAGQVDVLVNNAAEIILAPVESAPFDEVRRLYEINFFGALRTIQAFVPAMRQRRAGAVVNVSSAGGRYALPLIGIYASTKWALEGASESLRVELAHFGVDVTLVEPGMIGTGALDAPPAYFDADSAYLPLAASQKLPPREQMSTPEEIAKVVADAVERPGERFRWSAGAEVIPMLEARRTLDDASFFAMLEDRMGLASWTHGPRRS